VRAEDVLPQALQLTPDERMRLAFMLMQSVEASENEGEVGNDSGDDPELDDPEPEPTSDIPGVVVLAEARGRVKRGRRVPRR
jgi:hypothetical protein